MLCTWVEKNLEGAEGNTQYILWLMNPDEGIFASSEIRKKINNIASTIHLVPS